VPMVTNCSPGMSEWSRTTIIELINSTGRLTSSGLYNWFHLFTIVNINYTNSIIVKIFSINTNNTMFTSNNRWSSVSTTVPTRQMSFIWIYLDCWRKTFLANCRYSMMNLSFDDKQIANDVDWWTLTCRHRIVVLLFFYIQLRHADDDCQWLLLIEGGGEKESEEERRGTLVASHRSRWSSFSYLSTENLMGVSSLSHTSWLYFQSVVTLNLADKECDRKSLFYLDLKKDLSDIFLLLLLRSSSCSYSLRASYYVNE
jgi:hypothetical protein